MQLREFLVAVAVLFIIILSCMLVKNIINKCYKPITEYKEIKFYLSKDLYDVLDTLSNEESVNEYIGRLCQEIAETEYYIKQSKQGER